MRDYLFDELTEPYPGCNYDKYWSWYSRTRGRWVFKTAVQDLPEDLLMDPWGEGNKED